jgi:acyl-CoA reductase-like NAD-dependent aldehyde dehydrogenase
LADVKTPLNCRMRHAASAPPDGTQQSGNGRAWGRFGIDGYLEARAIGGWEE